MNEKVIGYNEDANLKMSPELEAELKEIVDSATNEVAGVSEIGVAGASQRFYTCTYL
jgi:hypothetical protein